MTRVLPLRLKNTFGRVKLGCLNSIWDRTALCTAEMTVSVSIRCASLYSEGFVSFSVWQWFQHCLIYNKNKMEKDAATDKATEIPCTDIFFCWCNLTASALATLKLFWKVLLQAQPELFTDRKNKFCFLSVSPSLPPLLCFPADISSYGYGQCQFSGAAGLNPSYQSGHSCAQACGGAAPAVGDPARLLLSPSGEGMISKKRNKVYIKTTKTNK